MKNLTEKQIEILAFCSDNQNIPSVRQIGKNFGITPRAVFDHLLALEKKGYLTKNANGTKKINANKCNLMLDIMPLKG